MARRGENIHKRKDGRWEGRYIKARTPDRRICWGYVYGTTYAEVKQRLIHKKSEYGGFQLIDSHHRMAAFYAELVAPKSVVKVANAHNTFTDKKKLTRLAYRNTKVIAVGEMVKKI